MHRRDFLFGLGASVVAAPAVVHAASLMPVRGIVMPVGASRVTPEMVVEDLSRGNFQMPSFFLLDGKPYWVGAINPSPRPLADEAV